MLIEVHVVHWTRMILDVLLRQQVYCTRDCRVLRMGEKAMHSPAASLNAH
jgi:hypothetical protein